MHLQRQIRFIAPAVHADLSLLHPPLFSVSKLFHSNTKLTHLRTKKIGYHFPNHIAVLAELGLYGSFLDPELLPDLCLTATGYRKPDLFRRIASRSRRVNDLFSLNAKEHIAGTNRVVVTEILNRLPGLMEIQACSPAYRPNPRVEPANGLRSASRQPPVDLNQHLLAYVI
jgi:hypothetical protein